MLSSHLRLGLPSGLLPSDLPTRSERKTAWNRRLGKTTRALVSLRTETVNNHPLQGKAVLIQLNCAHTYFHLYKFRFTRLNPQFLYQSRPHDDILADLIQFPSSQSISPRSILILCSIYVYIYPVVSFRKDF
jgi:hypothetical protein